MLELLEDELSAEEDGDEDELSPEEEVDDDQLLEDQLDDDQLLDEESQEELLNHPLDDMIGVSLWGSGARSTQSKTEPKNQFYQRQCFSASMQETEFLNAVLMTSLWQRYLRKTMKSVPYCRKTSDSNNQARKTVHPGNAC